MLGPRTFLVLLAVAALVGCVSDSSDLGPSNSSSNATVDRDGDPPFMDRRWPFRPAGMRVHPLSRLTVDHDTGVTVLETRVEFMDRFGDTTKATGILQVDLYRVEGPGGLVPMHQWEIDLADLGINRLHFDMVTRTYLLRLQLTAEEVPDVVRIVSFFRADDGDELSADREIRLRDG